MGHARTCWNSIRLPVSFTDVCPTDTDNLPESDRSESAPTVVEMLTYNHAGHTRYQTPPSVRRRLLCGCYVTSPGNVAIPACGCSCCRRTVRTRRPVSAPCTNTVNATNNNFALRRDYNCDSTTIRLRYDDTTTHSTTTEVIEIIRFHCDTTATRLRRKIDMLIFCSPRIASNGNRRARYVVVGS